MHTEISRYHATASREVKCALGFATGEHHALGGPETRGLFPVSHRIADRPSHRSADLPPMQTIC